jgi:hypothetical protein
MERGNIPKEGNGNKVTTGAGNPPSTKQKCYSPDGREACAWENEIQSVLCVFWLSRRRKSILFVKLNLNSIQ